MIATQRFVEREWVRLEACGRNVHSILGEHGAEYSGNATRVNAFRSYTYGTLKGAAVFRCRQRDGRAAILGRTTRGSTWSRFDEIAVADKRCKSLARRRANPAQRSRCISVAADAERRTAGRIEFLERVR